MIKLAAVLLIALLVYSLPFIYSDQIVSPDDFIFLHFARHLGEEGGLTYPVQGDELFGLSGFTPRYFVYHSPGLTMPRKFPGFILFWSLFFRFLPFSVGGVEAAKLVNPVCALIALALLFLIAKTLFNDERRALASVCLLASAPIFIKRSFAYNPTLFNAAVFLAALYFLLRALERRSTADYLFFGLAAGAFLWVRPTSAVYLAGFVFFILLERKRIRWRGLLAAVVPILALGVGLLIFNRHYYGSFSQIGYTVSHQPLDAPLETGFRTGLVRILDYLRFHPSTWFAHVGAAPVSLTIGFPLLALALAGFFLPREEEESRIRFRSFFLCLLVIAVAFFANFSTYGYKERGMTLHSSFLRYLVPVFCLMPLFTVRLLGRLRFNFTRAVSILAAFNLVFALVAPFGMVETVLLSRYYDDCKNFLLKETDPSTIFFSIYWDKLVYPERMVFTRGRHVAPEKDILEVIEVVIGEGYGAAYPYHPSDSSTLDYLRSRYRLVELTGPQKLSFPLNLLTPLLKQQPDIYPLKLYLVEEEIAGDTPAPGERLLSGEVED